MFNKQQPNPESETATITELQPAQRQQDAMPDTPDWTEQPSTITLSRPITVHGSEGNNQPSQLSIRPANLSDYIEIGDIDSAIVTEINADGTPKSMEFKPKLDVMMLWMERLTGQSRVILDQISPGDAVQVINEVRKRVSVFTSGNSTSRPDQTS